MRKVIRRGLGLAGFQLSRLGPPGSASRPIANMELCLQDLAARGLSPAVILDVGAHCGGWSTLARQTFPQALILQIEPLQEWHDQLRKACASDGNMQMFPVGAGAENCERVFTVWDDKAGSSFLPSELSDSLGNGRQRITPVRTIDTILSESNVLHRPTLVKLDIQGFELEALKGANSLFGETEVFIVECSLFSFLPNQPRVSEVMTFFDERGYCLYDIAGSLRRPLDGALGQLDMVFVTLNGILRANSAWE